MIPCVIMLNKTLHLDKTMAKINIEHVFKIFYKSCFFTRKVGSLVALEKMQSNMRGAFLENAFDIFMLKNKQIWHFWGFAVLPLNWLLLKLQNLWGNSKKQFYILFGVLKTKISPRLYKYIKKPFSAVYLNLFFSWP